MSDPTIETETVVKVILGEGEEIRVRNASGYLEVITESFCVRESGERVEVDIKVDELYGV